MQSQLTRRLVRQNNILAELVIEEGMQNVRTADNKRLSEMAVGVEAAVPPRP